MDNVGVGDARTLHPAFTPLLWPTATTVELLLVSLPLWPTATAVEILLVSLLVLLLRLQQGPADHILASSVISISNSIKFNQTEAVPNVSGFQSGDKTQHLVESIKKILAVATSVDCVVYKVLALFFTQPLLASFLNKLNSVCSH